MPVAKSQKYKEMLAWLRERAPEQTVSHSVFVAEYLASFAPKLGISNEDALAAGLLHDACRHMPPQELLAEARGYGIPLSDVQLQVPMLLHGPVAAEKIWRELDVDSEDVREAVCWHTTGRPKLGLLGQALYVADFAEPTRRFPQAAEARDMLRKNGFPAALLFVAKAKVDHLAGKEVTDPSATAFYLWVKKEFGA